MTKTPWKGSLFTSFSSCRKTTFSVLNKTALNCAVQSLIQTSAEKKYSLHHLQKKQGTQHVWKCAIANSRYQLYSVLSCFANLALVQQLFVFLNQLRNSILRNWGGKLAFNECKFWFTRRSRVKQLYKFNACFPTQLRTIF